MIFSVSIDITYLLRNILSQSIIVARQKANVTIEKLTAENKMRRRRRKGRRRKHSDEKEQAKVMCCVLVQRTVARIQCLLWVLQWKWFIHLAFAIAISITQHTATWIIEHIWISISLQWCFIMQCDYHWILNIYILSSLLLRLENGSHSRDGYHSFG